MHSTTPVHARWGRKPPFLVDHVRTSLVHHRPPAVCLLRRNNADGTSLIEHRMARDFAIPLHLHEG
jgi:hypothetical protein